MLTTVLRVVFPLYVVLIVGLSVVQRGPDLAVGGDKVAHFGAYFVMAFLGMFLTTSLWSSVRMLLLIAALGAALEGVQAMIPARMTSGWDLVANLVGVTVGTLVWLGVVRALRRWPEGVES